MRIFLQKNGRFFPKTALTNSHPPSAAHDANAGGQRDLVGVVAPGGHHLGKLLAVQYGRADEVVVAEGVGDGQSDKM